MNRAELKLLAQEVAAILKPSLLASDPHFTREEAAQYLGICARQFDRERKLFPDALKPNRSRKPLQWSRSRLDVYRAISAAHPEGKTG